MARLAAQSRAQKFLQVERVRIARDIHDDLGAQLTQLLLLGEVAQREQPENASAREQFARICDHARELAAVKADFEELIATGRHRERILEDHVYALRQHIVDQKGPPPPEWPAGLYR